MTEMLDRVAQTLAGSAAELSQGDTSAVALAVLAAIREPTAEMLALHERMAGNELCWDADAETLAIIFRAMIDAAIGPALGRTLPS